MLKVSVDKKIEALEMKVAAIIFLILVVASCLGKDDTIDKPDASLKSPIIQQPAPGTFKPPVIVQSASDSIEPWNEETINDAFTIFVGQFKFSDTVKSVDRMQAFTFGDLYETTEEKLEFDRLSSDGLQIYPDYATTVYTKPHEGFTKAKICFPLYIINPTTTEKIFSSTYFSDAIQEALDKGSSKWYAIETIYHDFCGRNYLRRKIPPGDFVMLLMPKYAGSYTTYIRTRISIGRNILISKPYKGVINKKQFTAFDPRMFIKESEQGLFGWSFLGAEPKPKD
jgi:hypothetical protein